MVTSQLKDSTERIINSVIDRKTGKNEIDYASQQAIPIIYLMARKVSIILTQEWWCTRYPQRKTEEEDEWRAFSTPCSHLGRDGNPRRMRSITGVLFYLLWSGTWPQGISCPNKREGAKLWWVKSITSVAIRGTNQLFFLSERTILPQIKFWLYLG